MIVPDALCNLQGQALITEIMSNITYFMPLSTQNNLFFYLESQIPPSPVDGKKRKSTKLTITQNLIMLYTTPHT